MARFIMMRTRLLLALLALLFIPASDGGAQRSSLSRWGVRPHTGRTRGTTDPYPFYTSLDLNTIPWHTGAGAWGAQNPIVAPTLPTTTRSVNCATSSCFNTEASTPGTQITVTADWSSDASIHADDIRVILNGHHIGSIEIGGWPHETLISRVLIENNADGTTRGGLMGSLYSSTLSSGTEPEAEDVVIRGVDVNGDSQNENLLNRAFQMSVNRMAAIDVRAISAGFVWQGAVTSLVVAHSSFYSGAATRASVGFPEGWTFRMAGGGPYVFIDSDLRSTRYHQLRPHSHNESTEQIYVGSTTFVAIAEGKTAWMWNDLALCNDICGSPTCCLGAAAIMDGCHVYSYSASLGSCGGSEISVTDVAYSRVRNTDFHGAPATAGAWTQTTLDDLQAAGGGSPGDHTGWTGNTFTPTWDLTEPAWGGAGDASAVPLPAGFTLITGEGSCPGAYAP